MIGFNKPYFTGKEFEYIKQAIAREKLSGNGYFTNACHKFFENRYGFKKTLLTNSCTAALEMAAILLDIKEGDEVIVPSYTFVSTANAFLLRGAKIIFCDSGLNNPNIDVASLKKLVTSNTKAIVVVHYAGVACDMDAILEIAKENNLYLVEDAAQAIDSFYKGKPLGGIGHLAAFSFHETKNIISGEGGMLVINDETLIERAEIIWEKGTNRVAFHRNEVSKYNWVDIGSSFLPSELMAAFLYAQLEELESIQAKRKTLWNYYHDRLKDRAIPLSPPFVNDFATNNAHIFYLVAKSKSQRDSILAHLLSKGIQAIFHYIPLHVSPYHLKLNPSSVSLPNAERYGDGLFRLPLHLCLNKEDQELILECILNYFEH